MPRLLVADAGAAYLPTASEYLRQGGVVALPTETVYGLAASLSDGRGVARIFALKFRADDRPLPLQFSSLTAAESFGFSFSPGARRLASRFWPGPLTLLLARPETLPPWVAPEADGIAVRVPAHPVALALLLAFGDPLAVTSANASGAPPALTAVEVVDFFSEAQDLLVLDGGRSPGGKASTVVDGRSGNPSLLRAGPISFDTIAETWKV